MCTRPPASRVIQRLVRAEREITRLFEDTPPPQPESQDRLTATGLITATTCGDVAAIFVSSCTGVLAYAQHFGSWVYAPGSDPITNEDTSMMFAPAREYPRGPGGSALVIRCQRRSTYNVAVYFFVDRYLGLSNRIPVTYRIGNESPAPHACWPLQRFEEKTIWVEPSPK